MAKKAGYYIASIAGTSDPSVILYFDGEKLWTHGSSEPIDDKHLLFIDEKPFEHRDVDSNSPSQDARDWFKEAKKID